MRVFILPSWCPTTRRPLRGTFFLEQARAIAALRPDWTVAIAQFDIEGSMVPWRPWRWPTYAGTWLRRPPTAGELVLDGSLRVYRVWKPFPPSLMRANRYRHVVRALADQVAPALDDFMRRFGKPDLLHAHAAYPGAGAAAILGKAHGIPYVITEHMGPFPPPNLLMSNGEPHPVLVDAYANAKAVSAVSSALASRLIDTRLAHKVMVLPNFLDGNFAGVVSVAPASRPFTFLSVGGPSVEKGTDNLIRAFAALASDALLRIACPVDDIVPFRQLADDLGIGGRVEWIGPVAREDMPALYADANAVVSPSLWESFSVVLIEALACGRPVIATRSGGPEDIVTANNGLLVSVGNVTELAAAMNHMRINADQFSPKLLQDDFVNRFSAQSTITKLDTWYRSIVAGK